MLQTTYQKLPAQNLGEKTFLRWIWKALWWAWSVVSIVQKVAKRIEVLRHLKWKLDRKSLRLLFTSCTFDQFLTMLIGTCSVHKKLTIERLRNGAISISSCSLVFKYLNNACSWQSNFVLARGVSRRQTCLCPNCNDVFDVQTFLTVLYVNKIWSIEIKSVKDI